LKLSEALLQSESIRKQKAVAQECEQLLALIQANPTIHRQEMMEALGWTRKKLDNRIQKLLRMKVLSYVRSWKIDKKAFDF
jgi:predicted HTH transcriptional regulator